MGETHTWLHGPGTPAQPQPPWPGPHGLRRHTRQGGLLPRRPVRTSPSTAGGLGRRCRLTGRHRPGNLSHEDIEEPPGAAPRRPRRAGCRHLGNCGGNRGGRPRPAPAVRSTAHRPQRSGQNGGGGTDPGGRGGRLPPAFSLLPATRRVGLAGCGGLLCAGGPGNARLLLSSPRGEGPGGAARSELVLSERCRGVSARCCGGVAAACSLHLLLPFVLDAKSLMLSCYWLEDAAFRR